MEYTLHLQKLLAIPDTEESMDGYVVFGPPFHPYTGVINPAEDVLQSNRKKNSLGFFPRPKFTMSVTDWEDMGRPTTIVLSTAGARQSASVHS